MAFGLTVVEMRDRALGKPVARRPCGACTACCHTLGVAELGKPYNCDCTYLTGSGCGAYGDRPGACREFECGWRMGLVPAFADDDAGRPDRLGLLFDLETVDGRDWLNVHETRPGAFDEAGGAGAVRAVLENLGGVPVAGVRLYPHGAEIAADFAPGAGYPTGAAFRRRLFEDGGGPPPHRFLKYVGCC